MSKTYTTVADKAVRDPFTEAMWDDFLKTNLNNLIVPPMCRCTNSAAISMATGTDTAATWDTEDFDTDSMHSTASLQERIVPTTAGLYCFVFNGQFALNATSWRYIQIQQTGVATAAINTWTAGSATLHGWVNCSLLFHCNGSTDSLSSRAAQNSGGNLNFGDLLAPENFFAAVWVGRNA